MRTRTFLFEGGKTLIQVTSPSKSEYILAIFDQLKKFNSRATFGKLEPGSSGRLIGINYCINLPACDTIQYNTIHLFALFQQYIYKEFKTLINLYSLFQYYINSLVVHSGQSSIAF